MKASCSNPSHLNREKKEEIPPGRAQSWGSGEVRPKSPVPGPTQGLTPFTLWVSRAKEPHAAAAWPPPLLTSLSSFPWGASSPDTHLMSLRRCIVALPRGSVSGPCPGATHSLVGRIVTWGAIRVPQAEGRRLQVAGAPRKTFWRRWCWH